MKESADDWNESSVDEYVLQRPLELMYWKKCGLPRWLSGKESACNEGSIPGWGRRKWQPTPVFLPGKSHGQRSQMGYSCKESDTTEWPHFHCHVQDSLCSSRQNSMGTLLLKGRFSTHTSANITFTFYIARDISGEIGTGEYAHKKKITWGTTGLDN